MEPLDYLLLESIIHQSELLANFVLQIGANINCIIPSKNNSLLHIACENNIESMVKFLIQKKININIMNGNGSNPIHVAIRKRYIPIIKILLNQENIILYNVNDEDRYSPIELSVRLKYYKIMDILLEKDNNFIHDVYGSQDGNSLLHIAVQSDNFYAAQKIISMGSKIDTIDIFGCTPLHYACESGDIEMVELLIENGADIFVKDNNGYSAIHWAVSGGTRITFEYLHDLGCNTKDTVNNNKTIIHLSIDSYRKEQMTLNTVEYILEKNKDLINEQDDDGNTALHEIVDYNDIDIIDLLLDYGADKTILNNAEETPYIIAINEDCRNRILDRL